MQIELFDEVTFRPLVHPENSSNLSIQDRFEEFHQANPWVAQELTRLAIDWAARGRERLGIGMLVEVLRWQYGRQTSGEPFKINNSFRSRYVRLIQAERPELGNLFETRELRSA